MSSDIEDRPTSPAPVRDDNPLEMILADHADQRTACALLDQVAALGTVDAATADSLRRYLTEDLPVHWQDEERDLFPLLRRRAAPEDALGPALARLAHDHDASAAVAVTLARVIDRMTHGYVPDVETRATLRAFAARERRHLVFENAVVIPLARVRLTAADRRSMLRLMAERRGQSLPTMP